jgi:outer membrane protein
MGKSQKMQSKEPDSGKKLATAGTLKLQTCVDYAIENNFSIRQSMEAARKARAGVELQKAELDLQLFASVRADRSAGGKTGDAEFSGGLTRKFVSGTEVDLEAGNIASRTGDFRDDYLDGNPAGVAINLRHPLLQGRGVNINQAGIRISELLNEQAGATVTAELLETLRTVETAYYAAAVAALVEKNQRTSLERARQLMEDVKVRRGAGVASQIDELEAEVALSTARERLVGAEKSTKDRIGELWLALGAPIESGLPEVSLTTLPEHGLPDLNPDGVKAFERAMKSAPSAILLVNEVQRRQVELMRAQNQALPRLDAEISAASADNSTGGSDWEGVALLRFNIPWGLRAEKAQLAAAKAGLEKSTVAQEEATQRLKQRIFELCRGIEAGRAQLGAATRTAEMNRLKWDEQLRRHKDGLVTVRDLRESEEELSSAEVREQQARLSLFAGWSALSQLDGSIVERHGLAL